MILPASYLNGFAPRDGQPLYPSLWKGCVGAWNPGLGPSGLTLRDWSGFGNNGTLTNGPFWVASQGRYAMNFDGVDDFANLGSSSAINLKSDMTFSGWFKANGDYTTQQAFIANSQVGTTANYAVTFAFSDNKFEFWNGAGGPNITSVRSISDNFWHYYAATRSGATGAWNLNLYIDGVLDKTGTASVNPSGGTTDIVSIGRFGGFSGYYLKGQLDDVRIYNRALSPQEIRTLADRRGIAYEMAARRRSSVQVTTNRLRRALIGS